MQLWRCSRMTAWRRVTEVMAAVGITGPHACPKGLRHGFGVAAVSAGIPLNLAQRWMGHAKLSTTAIYAEAVGDEELAIVSQPHVVTRPAAAGRRERGWPRGGGPWPTLHWRAADSGQVWSEALSHADPDCTVRCATA